MAQKKIKKIVVDRNICIGATSCVVAAGSVFEVDPESKAIIIQKENVKNSGPTDRENLQDNFVDDETLKNAAQVCPVKAITLFDEDGKQIYP